MIFRFCEDYPPLEIQRANVQRGGAAQLLSKSRAANRIFNPDIFLLHQRFRGYHQQKQTNHSLQGIGIILSGARKL